MKEPLDAAIERFWEKRKKENEEECKKKVKQKFRDAWDKSKLNEV